MQSIELWLDRVAAVAGAIKRLVRWIAITALLAFLALAVKFFDPINAGLGSYVLLGLLLIPTLICGFFYYTVSQLTEAPAEFEALLADESNSLDSVVKQFSNLDVKEPSGLFSLFSSVRQLKNSDGAEDLFDLLSGIALLSNPFFVMLVLASLAISVIALMLTPLVWFLF